jgi:hypothetical protein
MKKLFSEPEPSLANVAGEEPEYLQRIYARRKVIALN